MSRLDLLLNTGTFCNIFEKSRLECKGCPWDHEDRCAMPTHSKEYVERVLECLD